MEDMYVVILINEYGVTEVISMCDTLAEANVLITKLKRIQPPHNQHNVRVYLRVV